MVSKVYIVGCGMGNLGTLTLAAQNAIAASQLLIGAPRLLEQFEHDAAEKLPLIASEEIAEALRTSSAPVTSILMSGDIGFYSGATKLYSLLEAMEGLEIESIPGISSLTYFCAKLHTTWQDAFLVSAHGRPHNALGAIQSHAKTFLLTGGDTLCSDICQAMVERGLGDCTVAVGERLSYDDERITRGTATELAGRKFDGLAVMLVENPAPVDHAISSPYLDDEAFERGNVPMTKEEVRELAVCKLRIEAAHTVWDIGAGTGSVTAELARAAFEGQVFAIEKNNDAIALIEANKQRLNLPHIRVVAGEAPLALAGLPAPDRVFVGGSSGKLEDILRTALEANKQVRFCITAITLETLSDALRCIETLGLSNVDIVQLSFAKSKNVADYHMMTGANPIYLVSATGPDFDASQNPGARTSCATTSSTTGPCTTEPEGGK